MWCAESWAADSVLVKSSDTEVQLDPESLLEALAKQHEAGISIEQAVILTAQAPQGLPLSPEAWMHIAPSFRSLHARWTCAQELHQASKAALQANRSAFLRLLAFISDLKAYKDASDAQERLEYLLPAVDGEDGLFASPLYFPIAQDRLLLNSFVAGNGRTVKEMLGVKFEATPKLQGVCTLHTLVPFLSSLFSLEADALNSKEFMDFRKAFNKGTASMTRLRMQELGKIFGADLRDARPSQVKASSKDTSSKSTAKNKQQHGKRR